MKIFTLKAKKFLAELSGYVIVHNFPARIEDEDGDVRAYLEDYNPNLTSTPVWQIQGLLNKLPNGLEFSVKILYELDTFIPAILKTAGYKGEVWQK